MEAVENTSAHVAQIHRVSQAVIDSDVWDFAFRKTGFSEGCQHCIIGPDFIRGGPVTITTVRLEIE
jgi:hypothetical protein